MSESVVNVSGLTRRFGARTALASVSLSMSRGVVFGLVGANGAGKTTLIKHILGLHRGGHQWFGGQPLPEWFVGPDSRSIDATRQMWAFFRAHRLPRKSQAARPTGMGQ